jgi:hypothetical protein
MFNTWTIWWNADRLQHFWAGYWDAPIFYPERGMFACSDRQPATMIVAPWLWMTESPVSAYVAYLWLSLLLNAWAAGLLLRSLRVGWLSSFAGASAVVMLPIVWDNLDVLQLVPLWGSLLTLHALLRVARLPTAARGLAVGIAGACTFFTSVHHGLFLIVSLLPACLWLLPGSLRRQHLAAIATAVLGFSVLTAPLLVPMARVHQQQNFERSPATQASLSATPIDWLQVPARAWVGLGPKSLDARPLNPGIARCGLAALAAGLALRARRSSRRRRQVLFLFTFVVVASGLSLGTHLAIGPWKLWPLLAQLVPPLSSARSLFRFAYFAQLAIVLLAAIGADRCARSLRALAGASAVSPGRGRLGRWAPVMSLASVASLGLVLAAEVPPPAVRLIAVPDLRTRPDWVEFLIHQPDDGPILCLPFAEGFSEAAFERTTRWMLWAVVHGRPLVNGYSGFFPASWYTNVERLGGQFDVEKDARFLADLRVTTIVVDTRAGGRIVWPSTSRQVGGVEVTKVFTDEAGVEIWCAKRSP